MIRPNVVVKALEFDQYVVVASEIDVNVVVDDVIGSRTGVTA